MTYASKTEHRRRGRAFQPSGPLMHSSAKGESPSGSNVATAPAYSPVRKTFKMVTKHFARGQRQEVMGIRDMDGGPVEKIFENDHVHQK